MELDNSAFSRFIEIQISFVECGMLGELVVSESVKGNHCRMFAMPRSVLPRTSSRVPAQRME